MSVVSFSQKAVQINLLTCYSPEIFKQSSPRDACLKTSGLARVLDWIRTCPVELSLIVGGGPPSTVNPE